MSILKNKWFFLMLAMALIASSQFSFAQTAQDTTRNGADTIKQIGTTPSFISDTVKTTGKPKRFQPNPKKAGLYAAIFPGLGQAYNRNYWKIPVVYAGIAAAGYFYFKNYNDYTSYRQAYISRINNPYPTDKYAGVWDDTQLLQNQNESKKYLDMTVMLSSLGYVLQIVDAVTSAHLKNFDISRDISMHMFPAVTPVGAGISVVVNFH